MTIIDSFPGSRALSNQIQQWVETWSPQDIANVSWALATLEKKTSPALTILIDECVRRRLQGFNAQDLANVAWAAAKCDRRIDALFNCIASTVYQ